MAEVAELERQLQQLREAGRIKDDALRYLGETEDLQRERWALLRRVIEDAGKQYAGMRHDAVEEGLTDQGASLWLSGILTICVTLIPVTAVTGSFLLALTTSAQKLFTRELRSNRALLQSAESFLKRTSSSAKKIFYDQQLFLANQIKRTDDMVVKYVKNFLEPEVGNQLQTQLQNAADKIQETLGKQPFMQDSNRKFSQTNVPIVVVTQALHGWVDALVRTERAARRNYKDKVQDLFDIATSPTPAKEAKAKEEEAEKREGARERRTPYRKPVEKLPKTNKAAQDELAELRERLAPASVEKDLGAFEIYDLRELQLIIESMIWITTYDFTPKVSRENLNRDDPKVRPYWIEVVKPAPLPEALWKRLIERYIDPDEGKSYKAVGSLVRLGTKAAPSQEREEKFSPEVRLSHYFSQILYPKINDENRDMVRRFSALKVR